MKIEYFKRYLFLCIALFIMSLGVTFSIKADLGTSPISSVPYNISGIHKETSFFGLVLIGHLNFTIDSGLFPFINSRKTFTMILLRIYRKKKQILVLSFILNPSIKGAGGKYEKNKSYE